MNFIGLKRVLYGDAINTVTNAATGYTVAEFVALLKTVSSESPKLTEIENVHQDTWGYEESDPSVTDYINELTGQPYYRDITQTSIPTVSFTLGDYAFKDKKELQGGEIGEDGKSWSRNNMSALIEKCIVAQTKSGNWIFMPKANIIGKGNFVEKNIGLGVSAVPLETGIKGLNSEYWFKDNDVVLDNTQGS